MARVIGYVKSLEHGTFFVKDAKGNIHQLKAGEAIHEGELVYGSKSNPNNAQIIIDVTLQGAGDLVIAGNGALNFDTSLLKGIFSHDDAVVYVNSVKDALALAGGNITNVETDLRDGQPTNGDDETAAGQTLSNQEHASDTFNDRDGLIKDVRTLLNFTGNDVSEPTVETRSFRPVIVEETPVPVAPPAPSTAPTISINDVTVNEDAGTMSFTVTLNHATTAPVSFNYASSNNSPLSAEAGKDYSSVSGAGSIATGATTTTITVPISDDFLKEGNETFLMNLSNLSANVASSGNDLQGVGTITDAGSITPPTPEVPTTNDTVYAIITGPSATTEGEVTGNFTVSLVDVNGNPVTPTIDTDVTVVFSNGTAEDGDYVATTQTVTILANSANATLTVQTNEDVDYDNETFVATISTVENTGEFEAVAVHSTQGSVSATITDDDSAPTISINDVTVNEDAGTMSFTVTLNHATTAPVSFNYASSNNSPLSAEAGKDYSSVSGAGSIATGATTTTITVPISDDFLKEGNETFLMNLSNLSANVASSGNDLQGVGTITDAGSITPPTPEVPTTNDTVYARLVNSDIVTEAGGDGALNHRIELVDSNGNLVTVPTGGSVTVTLVYNVDTTSAGDYSTARTTSVTIPAGLNGVNISNAILNDAIYEANEGYTLTIGTVTQSGDKFEAIAQHATVNTVTGTITDSEDLPKVSSVVGDTVSEGTSNTFTVTLSNASTTSTTVNLSLTNGTASVGIDTGSTYSVSYNGGTSWTTLGGSTATIPAGATTFLVRVATIADFVNEGTETYTLTATANTVSGNGTGSILNVNHAPTPVSDTRTTPEDTPVSGNVLTNDTDPDSGTTLLVTQFVVNGTTYTVGSTATIVGVGTLDIGSNGAYTFTPVANWNGTVPQVTYTVSDGSLTATSTLNITVTPVNDAPISTNDAITILEDLNNTTNVYTLSVSDFGTYSDVDNNSLSSIRIDSLPTNGTLYLNGTAVSAGAVIPVASITGGLLTFDPINHTDADSSFTFSVNDGTAWSTSSYTTTVTINAVADTPVVDISGTGVVTQTITIANVTTTANGFTISALNANGSVGTISTHTAPDGFGVVGATTGAHTDEIGYISGTGSEKIVVQFVNAVSSVDVSFAWKHSNGTGETALVEFYNNGILIGTGNYNGGSDSVDPAITLQPSGGGVFNEIRFGAVGSGDDYLIHSISFEKTSSSTTTITTDDNRSVDLDASSALVDTDGSETLVTSISGLPVGYSLTDGTHTFTAASGATVANVTGWNLANLSLNVPTVSAQTTLTLTITATTTESSNGSNASASDTIDIIVIPYSGIPVLNDNVADVYESAMSTGTDSNSTAEVATGNIFTNDRIPVGTTLSNITIAGGTTNTTVAGQITVTTAAGNTLVVDTTTGAYTYTLVNTLDHYTTTETPNSTICQTTR